MKPFLIYITTLISLASTIDLTGRWETKPSAAGIVTGAVFKNDNTYEAYKNNEPFVSRTYSFRTADSIMTIQDGGCMAITGSYKVNFFSNGDSIRFTAINDFCFQRKAAIESAALGKVKQ